MISIIIPSVRDYRWKNIVQEFSYTKVDYEIIVCGPCPPQNLGPKFRAIQTNVKAAQCAEIAVRQSKGEYLFLMADDQTHTPGMLDVLMEHRRASQDYTILSPALKQTGVVVPPDAYHFPSPGHADPTHKKPVDTPIVPVAPLISRKDWDTIGGIDKNFVKFFWSLDIVMRYHLLGGKVVIIPEVFIDEVIPTLAHTASANVKASHHQDLVYLLTLWTDGSSGFVPGTLRSTRLKPFEPFVNQGITEEDQGIPDTVKAIVQNYDLELSKYIQMHGKQD